MTRHVVTYDLRMSRWRPGAQQRLAAAALELFTEQGFANTTVPQITARAGLTTRTFFRHFADKREVLFEAGGDMPALIRAQMAAAPPGLDPMTLIEAGLREVAEHRFEGLHDYLRTRRAVIRSDNGLGERELRKSAVLANAITAGFQRRGLHPLHAAVAAHIAVMSLQLAIDEWLDQEHPDPLATHVSTTLNTLRSIATHPSPGSAPPTTAQATTWADQPQADR